MPVHTTDDPPHAQRGRLTHLCVGHYTVTDTGHTTHGSHGVKYGVGGRFSCPAHIAHMDMRMQREGN